ncbi:unnamed protein product [Sympodiomycopsis kandeliae]
MDHNIPVPRSTLPPIRGADVRWTSADFGAPLRPATYPTPSPSLAMATSPPLRLPPVQQNEHVADARHPLASPSRPASLETSRPFLDARVPRGRPGEPSPHSSRYDGMLPPPSSASRTPSEPSELPWANPRRAASISSTTPHYQYLPQQSQVPPPQASVPSWTYHGLPPPSSSGLPAAIGGPYPEHPSSSSSSSSSSSYHYEFTSESRRKRLRNSRSCAECQRRKTRCDAVGALSAEVADSSPGNRLEGGSNSSSSGDVAANEGDMVVLQPCTNCSRSGVVCQYSKRPAKRGPSKGYIKDLESRLQNLENQTPPGLGVQDDTIAIHRDAKITPRSPQFQDFNERPSGSPNDIEPRAASWPEDNLSPPPPSLPARPLRPWEFDSQGQDDRRTYQKQKRQTEDNLEPSGPVSSSLPSPSSEDAQSVDAANTMVSLSSPASASSQPLCSAHKKTSTKRKIDHEESAVASAPGCLKPESASSKADAKSVPSQAQRSLQIAKKTRRVFSRSTLNGTFGMRPVNGQSASEVLMPGMDDGLVLRAMRLLAEPASEPVSLSSESRAASRMQTPSSLKEMPHPSGKKASLSDVKPHCVRLGQLQGQCMAGAKFNGAEGLLSSAHSAVSAITAARKVRGAMAALEGEALLYCYLDGLRLGNPDSSALAAACAKLNVCDNSSPPDAETVRRNCALFAIDRWHSSFFNASHALNGRALPDESLLCRQIERLKNDVGGALDGTPAEVLRAALMLNSLSDLASSHGGYKNITLSQCESIIHSAGAADERDDSDHGGNGVSADQSYDIACVEEEEKQAQSGPQGNLYGVAALKAALTGAFMLFYRLQTLPYASNVTLKSLVTILEAIEDCVLAGPTRTPLDPQTLLMRSFVGPFVFALATCAASWLSRAITLVAKRSHERLAHASAEDGKEANDLTQLDYLRTKLQDYVRMLGPLTIFSANIGNGEGVRPLWLRIAAYNHTSVMYLSSLTDITHLNTRSDHKCETTSPLHESISTLAKEVDGRASLIQDLGPMGFVLASSTAKEAWDLLPGADDV